MFHRNSLDATKHGCKLATQTTPHNMPLGVPAGGSVARKHPPENQAGTHQNTAQAPDTKPASIDLQNPRPPACTHAGNH